MSLIKKKLNHLVWDWNGTLLNDVDLCVRVVNQLLQQRDKKQVSKEIYLNHFTFPVIDFYRFIGFEFQDNDYHLLSDDWIGEYKRLFESSTGLHSNVHNVLSELNAIGLRQSILSACEKSLLDHSVSHHQLQDFFHHVFGVCNNLAHGKVHLAHEGIKAGHLDAERSLLIGDTVHDYEVASEAGLHCLLIANGHQHDSVLRKTGCPIVADISQVPLWLKENFKIESSKENP